MLPIYYARIYITFMWSVIFSHPRNWIKTSCWLIFCLFMLFFLTVILFRFGDSCLLGQFNEAIIYANFFSFSSDFYNAFFFIISFGTASLTVQRMTYACMYIQHHQHTLAQFTDPRWAQSFLEYSCIHTKPSVNFSLRINIISNHIPIYIWHMHICIYSFKLY